MLFLQTNTALFLDCIIETQAGMTHNSRSETLQIEFADKRANFSRQCESDLLFAHTKETIDENSLSGRLMMRMNDTTNTTPFKIASSRLANPWPF